MTQHEYTGEDNLFSTLENVGDEISSHTLFTKVIVNNFAYLFQKNNQNKMTFFAT